MTKSAQPEKKKKEEKSRGTTDELEILKLVILENPVLTQRILDRIRMIRSESKAAADYAAKKSTDGSQKTAKKAV